MERSKTAPAAFSTVGIFDAQAYLADPDFSGGLAAQAAEAENGGGRAAAGPEDVGKAAALASTPPASMSRPTEAAAVPLPPGQSVSWSTVRDDIQQFRAAQPPTLPFAKEVGFDLRRQRLYFVSADPALSNKAQTLFYADLTGVLAAAPGTSLADLTWRPLLGKGWMVKPDKLSKEEQLLRERMRVGSAGISTYLYDAASELLVFGVGGTLFVAQTDSAEVGLRPTPLRRSETGPRLDLKFGGSSRRLLSFVRDRDLWLYDIATSTERRLTYAAQRPGVACGSPDYVTQEEFHRFSGYWWSPDGSGRILAVEVDESAVETHAIQLPAGMVASSNKPGDTPQRSEEHRYPRAGGRNATSDLVLIEFQADTLVQFSDAPVVIKRLWGEFSLAHRYPWIEYLPRLGWLPDGKSVWVQGLDRRHGRTAWIKISLAEFMTEAEYEHQRHDRAIAALLHVPPLLEETSHVWINITDIAHFVCTGDDAWTLPTVGESAVGLPPSPPDQPSSPIGHGASVPEAGAADMESVPATSSGESASMSMDGSRSEPAAPCMRGGALVAPTVVAGWTVQPVQFIVASERTGFRHLYLVTYTPAHGVGDVRAITSGEWVVLDAAIHVDAARQLVYFMGKRETPLESHLYVASFAPHARCDEIIRLTELGYSHNVVFDSGKLFCIHGSGCEWFATTYSSVHTPHRTAMCRLVFPAGATFPQVYSPTSLKASLVLPVDIPIPEFFTFVNDLGATVHGCVYLPESYEPGRSRHPTLLKVYGGPHTQLVTNDYKFPRLLQLFLAVKMGFAVVLIDGRGSSNRGLEFESHLKYRMGTVELADQIQGLHYLDSTYGFIDRERVAVSGWSYGGYLSLMAIARHSAVFKLAICGAPVTAWEFYDTGYTEKYMGLPAEQPAAYADGSVLSYAAQFPSTENRVLLVHGLMDENVHFRHTEALVAELIKYQKPYQLQMYPNERHGIRQASANEHFETLMYHFLRNHL